MLKISQTILIIVLILGSGSFLWSEEVEFKYTPVDKNGPQDPWAKIFLS